MSDTLHFHLIAGIIMFSFGQEGAEQISSVPCNAIVRHTDTKFPAAKLAKAQQNLHKSFMLKMPEEAHSTIVVRDIVVTGVSYLGEMTEEEFQAAPEGTALVEAAPEVL